MDNLEEMKKKKVVFCWLGLCCLWVQLFGQVSDYTEWYLRTPDTLNHYHHDIYVREMGTGKDTVLVIHGGFGANHDYMLDAIRGLEHQYHFVLYDQRGSLLSPGPEDQLTFEKNVHDLDLLIGQLKLQKVKIMAHSMGTLVAMEYVHKYPKKVSNLVLIGAIPTQSDSLGSVFSKRYEENIHFLSTRDEIKALPIYKKYKQLNGKFESDLDYSDLDRLRFAATNIYKIERYKKMRGGFSYFMEKASGMFNTVNWNYDYRASLNDKCITTLIQGDFDFIDFKATKHIELLKPYPKVKVVLIQQAGHNIWIDAPVEFRKALNMALKRAS